MKALLQPLHSVVGVEGVFVCDRDGKVLASTCPDSLKQEDLAKIGYAFSLGLSAVEVHQKKAQSIYGTFENGRVIVRPFDGGLIVVLGARSIKQLLLKVALDNVASKLGKLAARKEPTQQRELQIAVSRLRVDQAGVDADLVAEWKKTSQGASDVKQVELQTPQGKVAMFKIKARKGLETTVEVNSTALKELGLAEGETVIARPVIRLASEVEEFFG